MSVAGSHPGLFSFDEYLDICKRSEEKLEFMDGRIINLSQVIAMAGGSVNHSLISANVIREAGNRLRGTPGRAYDCNLRVGTGRHTYSLFPDITIVCGEPQQDPRDKTGQTCTNPAVVIEVLSPSSFRYDFGEKFRRYREIDSLREYVIIHQDHVDVNTYERTDDGSWKVAFFNDPAGRVPLASVGIELSMAEIYDGVTFPPPETASTPGDVTSE